MFLHKIQSCLEFTNKILNWCVCHSLLVYLLMTWSKYVKWNMSFWGSISLQGLKCRWTLNNVWQNTLLLYSMIFWRQVLQSLHWFGLSGFYYWSKFVYWCTLVWFTGHIAPYPWANKSNCFNSIPCNENVSWCKSRFISKRIWAFYMFKKFIHDFRNKIYFNFKYFNK